MRNHGLVVAAFVFATLVVQGVSHGVVAAGHYGNVAFLRPEPIVALGVLAMVIQGVVASLLYARVAGASGSTTMRALIFSWAVGLFLVSYIAFAETAKYEVPSAGAWMAVELASGLVQFTVFGVLLGLIYRERAR